MSLTLLRIQLLVVALVLMTGSLRAQSLYNKAFSYEGHMGNLEPALGPGGFLICSTVRFGLGDIDGFQFTRLLPTGDVLNTRAFTTGPLTNVMQYSSLSLCRTDGTFSFLFGNRIGSGDKWSLRIFNTSSSGTINWNRKLEYVDPNLSMIFIGAMEPAFEETSDGGYLITGLMEKPTSALIDTVAPMVVKLDATGNEVWNKAYDLDQKVGWHLVSHVDESGATLLGFHVDSVWKIISDNCILTRIDPNGNTVWSKRVDGFNGRFTGSTMIEGHYVVSAMDSASIYTFEIDTAGFPIEGKRYDMTFPLWTWSARIVPTYDQGLVLTTLIPDSVGNPDVFFFKVDSTGEVQWQRAYGNTHSEHLVDLVQNGDSTFSMLSRTQILDSSTRYYLSKLDALGLNDCISSANGIAAETTFDFSMIDVTLNYLSPQMIAQPLYINDSTFTNPTPVDTCLYSDMVGLVDLPRTEDLLVYPNPTTGTSTVRITADLLGANFTIVDLLGKLVKSNRLSALDTPVDLDAFPAGIYTYHVTTSSGRCLSGRLEKE